MSKTSFYLLFPSPKTILSLFFLNLVNGLASSLTKSRIRFSKTCLNYILLFSLCPFPPTAYPSLSPVILSLFRRSSPPCLSFALQLLFDHLFLDYCVLHLHEFPATSGSFSLLSLLKIFFHHLPHNGEAKLSPKLGLSIPFAVKSPVFHALLQAELRTPLSCSC